MHTIAQMNLECNIMRKDKTAIYCMLLFIQNCKNRECREGRLVVVKGWVTGVAETEVIIGSQI